MQPLNEVATRPAVLKTSRRRRDLAGLIDSLLLIVARIGANCLALVWTFLLARMVAPAEAGLGEASRTAAPSTVPSARRETWLKRAATRGRISSRSRA